MLLQITKSTINPVDALYQPSPLEPVVSTVPFQPVLRPEPTQLCDSEQRPSSLPVGPVLATLGHHQTPTPNSTGTDLCDSFTSHNCPLTFEICV